MENTLLWAPQHPEQTTLSKMMQWVSERTHHQFDQYEDFYQWSIKEPALFWSSLVEFFNIQFTTQPTEILNHYEHPLDARWFSGATFNYAEQLLKRNDDHPALISVHENNQRTVLSYQALNQVVAACANGLKALGVVAGDRIGAIMPNVSETIIAMLASASLGAIWSSCSSDFGAEAAIDRLGQIEPKILFMADGQTYAGKHYDAREKIFAVMKAIPSIQHLIICPTTDVHLDLDLDLSSLTQMITWKQLLKPTDQCSFKPMPFNHPLMILFSSGTTGKPKCIVHGAGGTLLQHLKELGLHSNLTKNDNLCFFTTCGWMMWNWMVSGLALGATLTLYEGSPTYPDPLHLLQVINDEAVSIFGTSAKYLSTIEKTANPPKATFRFEHLKTILSTGSPLLPQQYDFVMHDIKSDVQLASISGGTDIVSCFALGNPLLPVYRGELQCIGLGMAVEVFNEQGQSVTETRGELVCTNAFPSMPIYFWNDPNNIRYRNAYFDRFPGVWTHGDYAEITSHHGLIIYGRSDTVLNPGGVRIGTAEIYRQIQTIPAILDSVVIGQEWENDTRIVLFVKLREDMILSEALKNEIRQTIRHNASPRHVPAVILQVPEIPRTINGKVVELAVRQIVHHQPVTNIQSIANPESLAYFTDRMEITA